MISKENQKLNSMLVKRLPQNAQTLFIQNLDYGKVITHRRIWKKYFTEMNPSYKDIMKCFRVMKQKKITLLNIHIF